MGIQHRYTTVLSLALLVSFVAVGAVIAGDVDGSASVNAIDVQLTVNAVLAPAARATADIDFNGRIDAIDIQLVVNAALGISVDTDDDGMSDAAESSIDRLAMRWRDEGVQVLWDKGPGRYCYAPSVVVEGSKTRYYTCMNRDPYLVVDYVYLNVPRLGPSGVEWDENAVLAPSSEGWDSVHTCDPDVVKGSFKLAAHTYEWAMFYLGVDVTTSKHNQLGVAFADAPEGPWVKFSGNPIVSFDSYSRWGVGQSSTVSVDQAGRVRVFYSEGDTRSRVLMREMDLTDLENVVVGPATEITAVGLSSIDGSAEFLHNAEFVYDPWRDIFLVTCPRHPWDTELPDFISSQLQIGWMSADELLSGNGSWKVLEFLGPQHTGYPRNHDCGLKRDPYGYLPNPRELTVVFAVGETGSNWLWSYRLHEATGQLVHDASKDGSD